MTGFGIRPGYFSPVIQLLHPHQAGDRRFRTADHYLAFKKGTLKFGRSFIPAILIQLLRIRLGG